MGEILDAWCAKEGPRAADTATLSSVMDQARITYQAKAIRDMNEDVGKKEAAVSCSKVILHYNSLY